MAAPQIRMLWWTCRCRLSFLALSTCPWPQGVRAQLNFVYEPYKPCPASLQSLLELNYARVGTGGEAGPSAKWYHAAFHTVTAVVGVGVLGLPYSFSYLGWYAGVAALVATLAASLYTAYLLSALHEEPDGRRHNRYVNLGRAILGMPPFGTTLEHVQH